MTRTPVPTSVSKRGRGDIYPPTVLRDLIGEGIAIGARCSRLPSAKPDLEHFRQGRNGNTTTSKNLSRRMRNGEMLNGRRKRDPHCNLRMKGRYSHGTINFFDDLSIIRPQQSRIGALLVRSSSRPAAPPLFHSSRRRLSGSAVTPANFYTS